MTTGTVTLVASVIAALSALIGVIVNVFSTGKTELEKWRRQEERKTIATLLTLLDKAQFQGLLAASKKREWLNKSGGIVHKEDLGSIEEIEEARRQVMSLHDDSSEIVAELELMAGKKVVDKARLIQGSIETLHHWTRLPASADRLQSAFALATTLRTDRIALVELARRDLNIDRFPSFQRIARRSWRLVSLPFRSGWTSIYRWAMRRRHGIKDMP